ncbi:MAG TPA: MBL fold metallo-hydrolase, partial [Nitrospiraceae bacterium]
VDLLANIGAYALDCRMLFLGDRLRQLVRTYEEIVHRFHRIKHPARLFENLQSSEEIKQFYEIHHSDGVTSVLMHPHVFAQRAPVDDLDIDLRFQLGRRSLIHPLPVDKIRALGHLLPLLRADLSRTDIGAALGSRLNREESDWAVGLLQSLIKHDYLTATKLPRNRYRKAPSRSRVTFLGHSSLMLQSPRAAVVADTCLRLESRLPAHALDVPRSKPDAICISHSHWDHCDLQSLLWFDKNTQVIIPRVRRPTAFNPPIVDALRMFGFTNIREVDLWETVQVEDIQLITVPFHGEQDEPDAEIDHFTYVLKTDDLTIYAGVDSYRDTFGDMIPVLERVREEYHPVLAFLPVSRMIYHYKWGGVNGFCRYLDTTLLDQCFQYTASAEDAAQWVAALRPRWAIPYATFNFWPWSTPVAVQQFDKALRAAGLANTLHPLRPFGSLAASDLAGPSNELRRRMLVNWFRFGSTMSAYDRRLQTNREYRYLRRRLAELAR